MFRAIPCSSSGGQIVLLQHLVSSLSVSSYSVHRLRADCSPLSTDALNKGTYTYHNWKHLFHNNDMYSTILRASTHDHTAMDQF